MGYGAVTWEGYTEWKQRRRTTYGRHQLPRERLLAEVDIPLQLAVANGATELVSKATGTACGNASSTDTLLHLLVDQALDVRPTGEHLDA